MINSLLKSSLNYLDSRQFLTYLISYSFLRFLIIAGGVFLIFYFLGNSKNWFQKRQIQPKKSPADKIKLEIYFAIGSILSFILVLTLTYALAISQNNFFSNFSQAFFDINERPFWYHIITFLLLFLFHDVWFYWTHRFLHTKFMMTKIHKYHHLFRNPTPFATFAVHPVEALIEHSYLLIFSLLFPIFFPILFFESLFALIFSTLWHSGYEVFPQAFAKNRFLKLINNSTHHNLHHQKPLGGYSFVFNFWDQIFKTNRKEYWQYLQGVMDKKI